MNSFDLYIGAPVMVETPTGWKETNIYTLGRLSCKINNLEEYDYSKIHPIPLTSLWLLDVEQALLNNDMDIEYQSNGGNWLLKDTINDTIITTVKYQHELIKLFELLTGYDIFS
jgi:hypothetical protein